MMTVLAGQLDLLDLLNFEAAPKSQPLLVSVDEQRIICPRCRSNWGHGLKPEVLARLAEEHADAANGQCADMAAKGVTEPYYAPAETPWLSGTIIQYPRPKGYGGLYQLRKESA